jgi:hypothetical protein
MATHCARQRLDRALRTAAPQAARWLPALLLVQVGTTSWALGPTAPFTPAPQRVAVAGLPAAPTQPSASGAPPPSPVAATPATGLAGTRLGSRPQALIDGQWWPMGAQLPGRGQARLVGISAQRVSLRHADGRTETLNLFGDIGHTEWRHIAASDHPAARQAVRPAARSQP